VTASTSSEENTKPLSELPRSEEAKDKVPEGQAGSEKEINEQFPRVKSVITKKCDDYHSRHPEVTGDELRVGKIP
jgi:uncharacterized membrane protein